MTRRDDEAAAQPPLRGEGSPAPRAVPCYRRLRPPAASRVGVRQRVKRVVLRAKLAFLARPLAVVGSVWSACPRRARCPAAAKARTLGRRPCARRPTPASLLGWKPHARNLAGPATSTPHLLRVERRWVGWSWAEAPSLLTLPPHVTSPLGIEVLVDPLELGCRRACRIQRRQLRAWHVQQRPLKRRCAHDRGHQRHYTQGESKATVTFEKDDRTCGCERWRPPVQLELFSTFSFLRPRY